LRAIKVARQGERHDHPERMIRMNLNWHEPRLSNRSRPHPWYVITEIDLAPLLAVQETWLRLTDTLEAFADLLPQWPDEAAFGAVRQSLLDLAARSVAVEEDFFDRLMMEEGATPTNRRLLDLLERHRQKRIAQCYELLDLLNDDARAQPATELFGYLLRGFFDEVRESIVVERLSVLLLADRRLASDAREAIVASLV